MAINWLLESLRWKYLLKGIEKIAFFSSIKSVMIGLSCSIFTPLRLGEYFGRPMLISKEKRIEAVLANIVGSISQNIVTFGLGFIAYILLVYDNKAQFISSQAHIILIFLLFFIIGVSIFMYFFSSIWLQISKKIKILNTKIKYLHFLSNYNKADLLKILLLSFLRYIVFFSQYYFLLILFNININILNAFTAIGLSYVFLFSLPGIPIADIGLRASLSLFFIGLYTNNDVSIIFASSSLWLINIAIPALVGTVILLKNKIPIVTKLNSIH